MEENTFTHKMPMPSTQNSNVMNNKAKDLLLCEEEGHNSNNKNEKEVEVEEITGRERLKRHRDEVKGNVKIPENWGQEKLLKEWIDFTNTTSFHDHALFSHPHTLILTARDALAADSRSHTRLRIQY